MIGKEMNAASDRNYNIRGLSNVTLLDVYDCIVLFLIALQVFIFGFFGIDRIPRLVLVPLTAIRFLIAMKSMPRSLVVLPLLCGYLVFLSIVSNGSNISIAWSNFAVLFYSFCEVLYLTILAIERPAFLSILERKALVPINLLYIANYIVVYFQVNYHYPIAIQTGDQVIPGAAYYWDISSGLFQFFGTHSLCFFSLCVIIYNFGYLGCCKNPRSRWLLGIWNVAIIVITLLAATQNDNKALFILLPVVLVALVLPMIGGESPIVKGRSVRLAIALGIPLIVMVLVAGGYLDSIINQIELAFEAAGSGQTAGNAAVGSGERMGMISYGVALPSTWLFGTGFGKHSFFEVGYLGFQHFGQSDFGSIMIVAGVWVLATIVASYSVMLGCIAGLKGAPKAKGKMVVVGALFLLSIVYTTTVTNVSISICFALLIWALGFAWRVWNERSLTEIGQSMVRQINDLQ